jgi:hypothetical protein
MLRFQTNALAPLLPRRQPTPADNRRRDRKKTIIVTVVPGNNKKEGIIK